MDRLIAFAEEAEGRFFTIAYHPRLRWEVVLFLGPDESHPDAGAGNSLTAVGYTLDSAVDTALTILGT